MTPEQIREQMTGRKTERRAYREMTGGSMPANWQRHTVDIDRRPASAQDDELATAERGFRRARWAWLFLGVLVVAYVVVRVWGGGQ